MRFKSPGTGWRRGTLVKFLPLQRLYTFEVHFDGDAAGVTTTVKLRSDYYVNAHTREEAERIAKASGSWNVLTSRVCAADRAPRGGGPDAESSGSAMEL